MPGGRIYTPEPVADHDLNRGLAAWWLGLPELSGGRFLYDLLGRSHGTLTNGPTWAGYDGGGPDTFGVVALDGSNDYVAAAGVPVAGYPFAWECHLRFHSLAAAQVLCGFFTPGAAASQHYLSFESGALKIVSSTSANWDVVGTFVPSTGVWYHVLGVWQSATSRRLYVNGAASGTGTASRAFGPPTAMRIGVYDGPSPTNPLAARVAGVRLLARDAAADAAALYDQTRRGHPDTLRRSYSRVSVIAGPPSAAAPVWVQAAVPVVPDRQLILTPF